VKLGTLKAVSFQERQHVMHIFTGPVFMGIMAAFGHHGKLSRGQMMVKGHALLHLKEEAAVGVEHEGRAHDPGKHGPKIKDLPAVGPTESAELVKERFRSFLAVPQDELFFQLGLQILKDVRELGLVERSHGDLAVALGAGSNH